MRATKAAMGWDPDRSFFVSGQGGEAQARARGALGTTEEDNTPWGRGGRALLLRPDPERIGTEVGCKAKKSPPPARR